MADNELPFLLCFFDRKVFLMSSRGVSIQVQDIHPLPLTIIDVVRGNLRLTFDEAEEYIL